MMAGDEFIPGATGGHWLQDEAENCEDAALSCQRPGRQQFASERSLKAGLDHALSATDKFGEFR